MPWIKLLHIVTLLTWCGALLYLPALLLQQCSRTPAVHSFEVDAPPVPRMLFTALATPAALLAIVSGTLLFLTYGLSGGWLTVKLMAVAGMVLAHIVCGWLVLRLEQGYVTWVRSVASAVALFATLCMLTVLVMVLAKPLE